MAPMAVSAVHTENRLMSSPDIGASKSHPNERGPAIERLLFVSDVPVADVDELPAAVREVIDAAAQVYVLTPTLPGRLAWLADDVDRFRHIADERLDTVLAHMHTIGADARGAAIRGSVLTVIADAATEFTPDHILIALRVSADSNWQEHRLIDHIEHRFGVPVTTFAVDLDGHTSTADGPLLLCYDGSEDAKHAIQRAGRLLAAKRALVMTVWQPTAALGSFSWGGEAAGMVDFVELDRAGAEDAGRIADEGVGLAREAGLEAEPVAIKATGSVWKTIVETADAQDAAAIVMGSRGLTGVRSMLLGSVSSAVVHHADRPTLVVQGGSSSSS
jgi:nucleotide-binding universal stress UspA family protein